MLFQHYGFRQRHSHQFTQWHFLVKEYHVKQILIACHVLMNQIQVEYYWFPMNYYDIMWIKLFARVVFKISNSRSVGKVCPFSGWRTDTNGVGCLWMMIWALGLVHLLHMHQDYAKFRRFGWLCTSWPICTGLLPIQWLWLSDKVMWQNGSEHFSGSWTDLSLNAGSITYYLGDGS